MLRQLIWVSSIALSPLWAVRPESYKHNFRSESIEVLAEEIELLRLFRQQRFRRARDVDFPAHWRDVLGARLGTTAPDSHAEGVIKDMLHEWSGVEGTSKTCEPDTDPKHRYLPWPRNSQRRVPPLYRLIPYGQGFDEASSDLGDGITISSDATDRSPFCILSGWLYFQPYSIWAEGPMQSVLEDPCLPPVFLPFRADSATSRICISDVVDPMVDVGE
ncbi:hypothetical protein EXIGLDRAFT_724244 [Exidia glandulosa HHB12029]|uniref:Uncharacterized protein n=1 Tax=Exidia glandulosa HHB12029 TaxID=1314781 RepID=A0A165MS56_EXIGL|nr:hypothetical protein EXIGLDRAFT_724244 [Exidia glandulosa HHB12029]